MALRPPSGEQRPEPGAAAGGAGSRPRPHSPDAFDGLDVEAELQLHGAVHGDSCDLRRRHTQ